MTFWNFLADSGGSKIYLTGIRGARCKGTTGYLWRGTGDIATLSPRIRHSCCSGFPKLHRYTMCILKYLQNKRTHSAKERQWYCYLRHWSQNEQNIPVFGAGEVVAEKIRTDVFKVFRIRRSMCASICTHLCILYFVLQETVQQPLQNTLIFKTQGWHHLKTGFVPINGLKYCSLVPNKGLRRSLPTGLLPPTNEVWDKVMFLHVSVILFTRGSTWAGTSPGRYTPLGRYIPWAGTPPRQVHPPGQVHPQAGTLPEQVHPLGQVHPPGQVHPSPLGRYTPGQVPTSPADGQQAGGTHPTGMHSC